jgi:hypothetical protein
MTVSCTPGAHYCLYPFLPFTGQIWPVWLQDHEQKSLKVIFLLDFCETSLTYLEWWNLQGAQAWELSKWGFETIYRYVYATCKWKFYTPKKFDWPTITPCFWEKLFFKCMLSIHICTSFLTVSYEEKITVCGPFYVKYKVLERLLLPLNVFNTFWWHMCRNF